MTRAPLHELAEISDLIVDYDPRSLARRAVRRDDVLARLALSGQAAAGAIVAALPHGDGVLSDAACDARLINAHVELQRLNEEFLQGDRVLGLLRPLVATFRATGVAPPYRVVDVGCGLGFVIRWLAANGGLGDDVRLMGCDLNVALVAGATRLAAAEALPCRFVAANAFHLGEPAHVYISSGVLHHFRGPDLVRFFAEQAGALAFAHFDIQRTRLAPLGAWLYHASRMREPLARHDGVVSAARAHDAETLVKGARDGLGSERALVVASVDRARTVLANVLRPMHGVLGIRPAMVETFLGQRGIERRRFGAFA
jgi:SAM-dependent methyltransferase